MEVELWSGNTKAIVDPRGAWLSNVSDENGDILFPKRSLKNTGGETKQRGGCHVCLPNFGPGGDSGQPQHGFGREMTWEISDKTADSVLLELAHGKDEYEALGAELSYQLAEHALVMTLDVTNRGEKDLRVAPAFHPYFAMLGAGDVKINGEPKLLEELADTVFVSGKTQQLETPGRKFTLTSEGLSTWAHWTDRLGVYVCVEPTLEGYAFLKDATDDQILKPGNTKAYLLKIEWQ